MHFSTTSYNSVAHGLDHLWQSVCTYVRMGIGKDIRRSPVLTEHTQDFLRVSTFLRTGIELSVGVATFAKTIVAFLVNLLGARDIGKVLLSFVNILSTFQDNRTETQLHKPQGSEEATRTGTYHHHLRSFAYILIINMFAFILRRLLIHICAHLQVHEDGTLTSIYRALQYAHSLQRADSQSLFFSDIFAEHSSIGCHLRQHT